MPENLLDYEKQLDPLDPLASYKDEYLNRKQDGQPFIYLCGNFLGLQPKATRQVVAHQLSNWENLGVEGWFEGEAPWMFYHKALKKLMAPIVGASAAEVCPMNTLTVNLHLLIVSFYKPTKGKYKIIMEAGAFPSDQYAVESQLGVTQFNIITQKDEAARGAQLSIIAKRHSRAIFDGLVAHNVLGDWREPNVIRLSPVPLYNTFEDLFYTGRLLLQISKKLLND